ncbi:MAG: Uma2 family endonuclease [Spirochaetaceae bacterium]|nr:Uma2 family endonuclease [Spirochaetaceae bacterium]
MLTAAPPVESELRSFTYRDLLEMEHTGIIGEDERVELLGGRIYRMTIKPPHAWAVAALTRSLFVAFDDRATVVAQHPLRLSDDLDDTELPQPDVMLLREERYLDHPRPHHVLLLVEVSDSTLRKDTAIKLPLYAQVGIPELWIVNLVQRRLEVYTDPEGSDYRYRAFHELTATLAVRAFADTARQWLPDTLSALLDRHDVSGSEPTTQA